MHVRTLAHAAALAAALALPATASAQRTAAPAAGQQQNLLNLGRQQYDELRYEESIQTLSAAIIRRGNTPAQETQIYELLALAYLALNRNDESEGAFRLMLAREPDRRMSTDLAPRIIEFFTGVKQRWEAEGRPGVARAGVPGAAAPAAAANVTIEHRSPAQQQRERPVPLAANVLDPQHRVRRLVLAYRQGSRGLFRRIDATAGEGGAFTATIPGSAVRPPLVEYYFEAVDANGVPVQARGDAFAPLRVAVPEPGGIPWWVFVGGGALVVGAGVVIAIVATQAQPATIGIDVVGN